MENTKLRVSENDLARFKELDSNLIKKIYARLTEKGYTEKSTENFSEYYAQDIFKLGKQKNKKNSRIKFKTLRNEKGELVDSNFIYFLGADTEEFHEMSAILKKYNFTMYDYLKIPLPN